MSGRQWVKMLVPPALLLAAMVTTAEDERQGSQSRGFIDMESVVEQRHDLGRSENELPGTRLSVVSLSSLDGSSDRNLEGSSLWDGDVGTAIAFDSRNDDAVVFHFPGAARWINELELTVSGRIVMEVDGLLPTAGWVDGIGRIDTRNAGDDPTTVVASLDGTRYQAIRLRIKDVGATSDTFEILDMGMFWFEEEMTKDAKEVAGEWCEDYAGTGNDLTSPSDTVGRFLDYFDDHGWTLLFEYGNSLAWEEDFKRHDLGGTNGSYVDATDHIIYCGHGTTDATSMARTDRDDANVTAADINGAWDQDLEWGWFHCCLNMSSTAWGGALDGSHTISGAINVINGSKNWGKTIAQKLDSTWFADPAWTIWQAWWHSNDTNQPAGNQFRMLAEDYMHYNEYIWGEGDTESDSNDSYCWSTSQTVSKDRLSAQTFYGKPNYPDSEPIVWEPPASLGEPGHPALKVLVRPEVLEKRFRQEVGVFDVDQVQMNEGMISELFVGVCEALGLDSSNLAAGREDETTYAAASGLASMSGFTASGGWMFTNQETHLIPGEAPQNMVTPSDAEGIATEFLNGVGLIGPRHYVADTSVMSVQELEGTQVLREFPFAYDVIFGRRLGPVGEEMPVIGPGGRVHACIGPDGGVQAFNHTSRRLTLNGTVAPIPIETALDHLAAFGYASLQSAPEFGAFEVLVNDANLGYYEMGINDPQDRVGPAFYLDVVLKGDSAEPGAAVIEVPARIYMSADAPPVRAQILTPGDGDQVEFGSQVTFTGRALGGVGPHQFIWFSSTQGLLSTQSTFTTSQLMPGVREAGIVDPVTVELRVVDANGYVSSDQISLVITGLTGVDDTTPSPFRLEQNRPNPFNPRTVVAFSLPAGGDVTLTIFDVQGHVVRTLVDEAMGSGPHSRVWDATNDSGRPVPAGVYLYRLHLAGDGGSTMVEDRKMILLK